MSSPSHGDSPAILLKLLEYGDFDLIVTFLTRTEGKISVMAKAARKSVKRFGGALELFSLCNIAYTRSGRGMTMLNESTATEHFARIRTDIVRTAIAGYWSELVNRYVEEGLAVPELFDLLAFCLSRLDHPEAAPHQVNVVFQARFLALFGLAPHVTGCLYCQKPLEGGQNRPVRFDHAAGGVVCARCAKPGRQAQTLSLGTLQLVGRVLCVDVDQAMGVCFSAQTLAEARGVLEAFVVYHMGCAPKSLRFLQQLQGGKL